MKKPLLLLCGIIISFTILSIIFPSDPSKPDILDIIKKRDRTPKQSTQAVESYRIEGITRIDGEGKALVWSNDERFLYYSKTLDTQTSLEEIWITDLKGSRERVNSKIKFYDIRDAKMSPNGKYLSFLSGQEDDKASLYIYDIEKKAFKDITPKKVVDVGVTSYDWDDESMNIIMSMDIESPRIEIYSFVSQKSRKLDMQLKSCRNVAFYKDMGIIFSDQDKDGIYKIYNANISGKNPNFIIVGQDFKISPDREKIAILTDENSQQGLWIYNIGTKEKNMITLDPVRNIYWISNNTDVLYSLEEDCVNKYPYKGNIYYVEKFKKKTNITGAVHTIFVASSSGKKIAITSPSDMDIKDDYKGVFLGDIYK